MSERAEFRQMSLNNGRSMTVTVTMVIADAVVPHGDGTVTLVRSGLSNIKGSLHFSGAAFVTICGGQSDENKTEATFQCVDSAGILVTPEMPVHVSPPKPDDNQAYAIKIDINFPAIGDYFFIFTLGSAGSRLKFAVLPA